MAHWNGDILPSDDLRPEQAEGIANSRPATAAFATIYPPDRPVPDLIANTVLDLERELQMPVLCLLQGSKGQEHEMVSNWVYRRLMKSLATVEEGKAVALLIDSSGGYADEAYKIARLLQKHCGGFTAVVPRYAKSAATLLTLGADRILMGRFAELGPIDAQLVDYEREETLSALDEVQTLERLNTFAMTAIDEHVTLFIGRSGMKVKTLLPIATQFVTDMIRPLFEKINTVHYTKMGRILKVAQEYAQRLLERRYGEATAEQFARTLTENYPAHGFVVDSDELRRIGLEIEDVSPPVRTIIERLAPSLGKITVLGRILSREEEVDHDLEESEEKSAAESEVRSTSTGRGRNGHRSGKVESPEPLG